MIILGITGQIGSGKDTFSEHFLKIAKGKSIVRMRFSDLLRETLTLWSLPHTRHNLQYLAIIMDKEFGKGTLTNALYSRVKNQKSDIVILEGVRWKSDVELLRKFENNYLIYITADQKVRFKRVKNRNDKSGENNLTIDQFMLDDKEPTEIHISEIGTDADVKIENSGSISEFYNRIEDFYKSNITH